MPAMTSPTVLRQPSYVRVHTETGPYTIRGRNSQNVWQFENIGVAVHAAKDRLRVELTSPVEAVRYIEFRWQQLIPEGMKYLGDHWERGYGDLSWMGMTPDKPMPWYFFAYDGKQMFACGVKTGARAFCWWHVDPFGIRLWMDVRSGGVGVKLGERTLEVATVVERDSLPSETPYESASRFTAIVCDKPLLPKQPIYGANNFYYAYGESSHDQVLQDSKLVSELSGNNENRPFSIIDMGWENNAGGTDSPWRSGNKRFPDMAGLAGRIKKAGARPGIWYRPLLANAGIPASWVLECRQAIANKNECIMDPTVPDVLERIKQDVSLISNWGFELIKYDCTTHDLLGCWGAMMGRRITEDGWHFADQTRTTAEILTSLYSAIHEAAGDSMLMGCNTVGHLCAGHVHSQRIGDNTSGRDWLITRKMGINSLAFRALQHGYLFATDADCVGMTSQIPWRLNEQWLELLAASGTSMFVSVQANTSRRNRRSP
jgi:alpha-galactosidase